MAATKVFDIDFRKGSLISEEGVVGTPSGSYEFVRTEKGYGGHSGIITFGSVGDYIPGTQDFEVIIGVNFRKIDDGYIDIFRTGGITGQTGVYVFLRKSTGNLWARVYDKDGITAATVVVAIPHSTFFVRFVRNEKTACIYVYDKDGNLYDSSSFSTASILDVGQYQKLTIETTETTGVYFSKMYYGILSDSDFNDILSDFVNSHPTGKPIQYHNFTFPTKPAIVSKDSLVFKLPPQITGNKVVNAVAGGEDIVGTVTQVDQAVDGFQLTGGDSRIDINPLFDEGQFYTVNCVIYYDADANVNSGDTQGIFSNSIGTRGLSIRNLTKKIKYQPTGDAGYVYYGDTALSSGLHIISLVINEVDNTKAYVYLDGHLDGSFTAQLNTMLTQCGFVGGKTVYPSNIGPSYIKFIDFEVYNKALSESEIKEYHNQYLNKLYLNEDFSRYPVGGKVFGEWIKGTGEYSVDELTSDDDVLSHLTKGTKVLKCSTTGTIAIPSKKAYGRWEFDVYKGSDVTKSFIGFMNPDLTVDHSGGYEFGLNNLDARLLATFMSILMRSAATYVSSSVWYRIRIDRTPAGEFSVYIKGGAFGDTWILVDTTGGSGTNPVTDNTHTDSKFFVLDLDAGDRIANIQIYEGIPIE